MRTANWTVIYHDNELDRDFFVFDFYHIEDSVVDFSCTADVQQAITMCWSAAVALVNCINTSLTSGTVRAEMIG